MKSIAATTIYPILHLVVSMHGVLVAQEPGKFITLEETGSLVLPATFAPRGADTRDGITYVLHDERAIGLVGPDDGFQLMALASDLRPKAVRFDTAGLIEVVDAVSSTIIVLDISGRIVSKRRLPIFDTLTLAVPLHTGWLLGGVTGSQPKAVLLSGEGSLSIAPECLRALSRRITSARAATPLSEDSGTVSLFSMDRGDVLRLFLNSSPITCMAAPRDYLRPRWRLASATHFGNNTLLVTVDPRTGAREFLIVDAVGAIVKRSPGVPVGFLTSHSSGVALGYRQLPLPEVVFYRFR